VIEGRCPACRAARQHVHHHFTVGPQLLIAVILVLTILLLVTQLSR
jgi:hypothetical protein